MHHCNMKLLLFLYFLSAAAAQQSNVTFRVALKKFKDGDASALLAIDKNLITDTIMNYTKTTIIEKGLDPVELNNETLQLGVSGIDLKSGWLMDMSTIKRSGDVVVTNPDENKVTIEVPLTFKSLLFTYDYETSVNLMVLEGEVHGKIDNVLMDLKLSYDRVKDGFSLDSLSMDNFGKITVKFSGNELLDWFTNAMTRVITVVLHPVIVSVLSDKVHGVLNSILDGVYEHLQ